MPLAIKEGTEIFTLDSGLAVPEGKNNIMKGDIKKGKETRLPSILVHRDRIPWLPNEEEIVNLKQYKLESSGMAFYLGNLVRGKRLVDAVTKLHRDGGIHLAHDLLRVRLNTFLSNQPDVNLCRLSNSMTMDPVMYAKGKGGIRVYFMKYGKLDSVDVVMGLAMCDKSTEAQVLATLTNNSAKNIKRSIN